MHTEFECRDQDDEALRAARLELKLSKALKADGEPRGLVLLGRAASRACCE